MQGLERQVYNCNSFYLGAHLVNCALVSGQRRGACVLILSVDILHSHPPFLCILCILGFDLHHPCFIPLHFPSLNTAAPSRPQIVHLPSQNLPTVLNHP